MCRSLRPAFASGRILIAFLIAFLITVGVLLAQNTQTVKPPGYQNQPTPTQQPSETPKTAPQTRQVLPSYEGQTVTSVELAGQPDFDTKKLVPLLQQRGIFRTDYEGRTLRDHFALPRPFSRHLLRREAAATA